jgi:hypothetical protein
MPSRALTLLQRVCTLVLAVAVAGCVTVWPRVGARPNIAALEVELRVGESTQEDVRYFLGKPYGQGKDMLPTAPGVRSMWVYYYATERTSSNRYVLLLVFFDADRYDGYLWFSSLPS